MLISNKPLLSEKETEADVEAKGKGFVYSFTKTLTWRGAVITDGFQEEADEAQVQAGSGSAGASVKSYLPETGEAVDLAMRGFNGKHSPQREQVPL